VSTAGCSADVTEPIVRFTNTVVDAGTLFRGQVFEHGFEFVNDGNTAVEFADVSSSCGCTVAMPSAHSVGAGQKGQVAVRVTTMQDTPGPISKKVTLTVDTPERPQIVLEVRGTLVDEFTLSDRSLDFTDTTGSGLTEASLLIMETSAAKLISAETTDDRVAVTLAKVPSGSRAYVLTVSVRRGARPGWLTGNVIVSTDSRYLPEIIVPLRGPVPPSQVER
jgi:hypothetical protein